MADWTCGGCGRPAIECGCDPEAQMSARIAAFEAENAKFAKGNADLVRQLTDARIANDRLEAEIAELNAKLRAGAGVSDADWEALNTLDALREEVGRLSRIILDHARTPPPPTPHHGQRATFSDGWGAGWKEACASVEMVAALEARDDAIK